MDGILITEPSLPPQLSGTATLPRMPGQASRSSAWQHPPGPGPLDRRTPKPKAGPQPQRPSAPGLIAQPGQAGPGAPQMQVSASLGVRGACLQPGRPGGRALPPPTTAGPAAPAAATRTGAVTHFPSWWLCSWVEFVPDTSLQQAVSTGETFCPQQARRVASF